MESIKRFLKKGKGGGSDGSKKTPRISEPIPGTFTNNGVSEEAGALVLHNHSSTTSFVPKSRGNNATEAWLRAGGTAETLRALVAEQKHAAKENRLGPKTRGVKQVQEILRVPSRRAVEELCRVRHQAEMVIRYGSTGVAVFNFSKSVGWNAKKGSQIPSLQLRNVMAMGRRVRVKAPAPVCMPPVGVPHTPIDWLVLPPSVSQHEPRSIDEQENWSPVSEAGGWRDDADRRLFVSEKEKYGLFIVGDEEEEEEEEEEEVYDDESRGNVNPYDADVITPFESEAKIVTVIPVPLRQVRTVNV